MDMANLNGTEKEWWTYGYQPNETYGPEVIPFMGVNASPTPAFPMHGPTTLRPHQDISFIVIEYMRTYYTPLIIAFGLIGNTLTWVILLKSRLRSLSSSHYLAAIVMVNTLYLLSQLIHWLLHFGVDFYNKPGWCQFVNFFNSSCSFLSVWYMTAFCVDRYICICWPTEAPKMCTRMRARVVIISLLCVSTVIFMNTSLTYGVKVYRGRHRCITMPSVSWDIMILDIIDMFVNLGLPYVSVLVLVLLISCNTYRARRHGELADEPAQIRNVTITFLVTCLLFHLPTEVFRVVHTARKLLDRDYKHKITPAILLTQRVLQHLFHTSLASHFILFLLCYPLFRDTCKTPFNWLRERMLVKFRKAPNGDINLRNVRFHAVQEDSNATHV